MTSVLTVDAIKFDVAFLNIILLPILIRLDSIEEWLRFLEIFNAVSGK